MDVFIYWHLLWIHRDWSKLKFGLNAAFRRLETFGYHQIELSKVFSKHLLVKERITYSRAISLLTVEDNNWNEPYVRIDTSGLMSKGNQLVGLLLYTVVYSMHVGHFRLLLAAGVHTCAPLWLCSLAWTNSLFNFCISTCMQFAVVLCSSSYWMLSDLYCCVHAALFLISFWYFWVPCFAIYVIISTT